jgi:NADH:ubiquinone oxidoreductase subunit 5 (subunit L)/multisubunit Na+/H+ antiporter MnhA subunit
MQPEKLSDFQLYTLYANTSLASYLRIAVLQEMRRRNLVETSLWSLSEQYKEKVQNYIRLRVTNIHKIIIVLVPFIGLLVVLFANRFLTNEKMWREHWICISIANGLWAIILVVVSRLSN